MGSSLVLTGGAATAKTLKESIALSSHGFTVGDVVRFNAADAKKYFKAQADSAENAEVLGIVNAITDPNTFELTYGGYIDIPKYAGLSYPVLFLDSTVSGGLTHNPPSAVGTVIKPVVTRHPTLNGYVMNNYLGTQIGGSSTVGIDEVQPVGTIMPFAGTVTPDTWLPCEGNAYSINSYPELYSKLCYVDGARVPMYGHIAELTLSAIPAGTVVGDFVVLPTDGNSFPSTITTTGEEDTLNPLILAEGQIQSIDTVNKKITVLTTWKYNKTKKYFEYPNAAFKPATNYTIIYPAGWVSGNVRGTINATVVTAVSITHFLTPDLSSRFIVGSQGTGFAGQPENATFSYGAVPEDNSRGTTYAQGAFGGEERHTLTAGEMPSHEHTIYGQDNTAQANAYTSNEVAQVQNPVDGGFTRLTSATGGNDPHNNMPPYLAVRYIIKAKPYTRAAIIDSLDLPWSSTLVRDLRTRAIGGSNSDLVFYTNTAGDSGLGTERMRIYGNGNTGDILFSGAGDSTTTNPLILSVGGIRINSNRDDAFFISTKQDGTTVGHFGFNGYSTQTFKYTEWEVSTRGVNDTSSQTRLFINNLGNVGIGTGTPGASLDVNGTLKVGNFGGATNVMAKATNQNSTVGQIIPILTWGGDIGGALNTHLRNHSTPIPEGTWLICCSGQSEGSGAAVQSENMVLYMAQTWVVPSGRWLVFAHDSVYTATTTNAFSGVAWKLVTDPAPFRTNTNDFTHGVITSANGWNAISISNGTATSIRSQNANTATGGDKPASGCVYQDGGWYVCCQLFGYAIRIA